MNEQWMTLAQDYAKDLPAMFTQHWSTIVWSVIVLWALRSFARWGSFSS